MNHLKSKKSLVPLVPKTFQKAGKWIERPTRSIILICTCGNKYIKTRLGQSTCIRCIHLQ